MERENLVKITALRNSRKLITRRHRVCSFNFIVSKNEIMQFFNAVSIPQLTEDQSRDCEFILSEKDFVLV